jgi:hypothetical protein
MADPRTRPATPDGQISANAQLKSIGRSPEAAMWFLGTILLLGFSAIAFAKQTGTMQSSDAVSNVATGTPASEPVICVSRTILFPSLPQTKTNGQAESNEPTLRRLTLTNYAHAAAPQRGDKVQLLDLKRTLSTRLTKKDLKDVENLLRKRGITPPLTPAIEKEIRDVAAAHGNKSIEALIAAIVLAQMVTDLDQLIDEMAAIDSTAAKCPPNCDAVAIYDSAVKAYNDLHSKCTAFLIGIDSQMTKYGQDANYKRDWVNWRPVWQKDENAEISEEARQFARQLFKREPDASIDLLKRYRRGIEQVQLNFD